MQVQFSLLRYINCNLILRTAFFFINGKYHLSFADEKMSLKTNVYNESTLVCKWQTCSRVGRAYSGLVRRRRWTGGDAALWGSGTALVTTIRPKEIGAPKETHGHLDFLTFISKGNLRKWNKCRMLLLVHSFILRNRVNSWRRVSRVSFNGDRSFKPFNMMHYTFTIEWCLYCWLCSNSPGHY